MLASYLEPPEGRPCGDGEAAVLLTTSKELGSKTQGDCEVKFG